MIFSPLPEMAAVQKLRNPVLLNIGKNHMSKIHAGTIQLRVAPKAQSKEELLNDPYLREWVEAKRAEGLSDDEIIKQL